VTDWDRKKASSWLPRQREGGQKNGWAKALEEEGQGAQASRRGPRRGRGQGVPPASQLPFHIAFVTADVSGTLRRLLDAGAKGAGEVTITPAGDEMVLLRDPWGVALQLVKRAAPLLG
jgi:hypothetical protein